MYIAALMSQSSRVGIPYHPEFFKLSFVTTKVASTTAMVSFTFD